MYRILIPVDGSDNSMRAVEHVIAEATTFRPGVLHVDLLNVQLPVTGVVASFVNAEQLKEYHHEEGLKGLAGARERLQRAGIAHTVHVSVGDPARMISHYAGEHKADQIVIGTRGLGSVGGMLMGSVATKVVHLSDVPVLLVK